MADEVLAGRVKDTNVLLVCMGNICRSPTAEGVLRKLHRECAPQLKLHVDSAGTHDYHVDQPPDARAISAAQRHNIDISAHRGRAVSTKDFSKYDYILAMDRANLNQLWRLQPRECTAEVRLLLEFADECTVEEVPDPYYGGASGFEQVLELVRLGSLGFLKHLCKLQGLSWQSASYSPGKISARS
jgi:low molecular weight protein-tyrosine phosphatase